MAVLNGAERQRIRNAFMRLNAEQCAFTKTDLQAAVDATDAWIDANAASFNSALPTVFRNSASAAQKTALFCYTAERRAGLLQGVGD